MSELISQKAYAERIGVSKQYINKLVKAGKIPLEKGKVNPDTADQIIEAIRQPGRALQRHTQMPATPATPVEEATQGSARKALAPSELPTLLLKTKIKSETEKAKLLEIKAKVEVGKYIDRDEAEAQIFNHFRPLRDSLLTIPDRLDAELAAATDRHIVHKILYNEIVRVLDDANKPVLKKKR